MRPKNWRALALGTWKTAGFDQIVLVKMKQSPFQGGQGDFFWVVEWFPLQLQRKESELRR